MGLGGKVHAGCGAPSVVTGSDLAPVRRTRRVWGQARGPRAGKPARSRVVSINRKAMMLQRNETFMTAPAHVRFPARTRLAHPPGAMMKTRSASRHPADGRLRGVGRVSQWVSGPPDGLVTLLFTDVEGAVRLWEADRDAMAV